MKIQLQATNGALGGYLYLENILAPQEKHQLVIGQGHTINRPGTLYVTITPDGENAVIEVAGAKSCFNRRKNTFIILFF